ERRRLERIRAKTPRLSLDAVFVLDSVAETLVQTALTLPEIVAATSRLKAFQIPPPQQLASPGVEAPKPAREVITRAIQDLSKITKAKDIKRAASVSESLGRVVDALLADTVRSLVYALALGDPDRTVLAGVDVSARHDFGFVLSAEQGRSES